MDIAARIKKAPRWAWYTAGGVAVGAGAIRLWRNRTTSDGETPLEDSGAAPVEIGQQPQYGVAPGGAGSVIVPPIITNVPSTEAGVGEGVTAGVGAVATIVDSFGAIVGGALATQSDTIQSLIGSGNQYGESIMGFLANAGSAPAPAAQQPTPVITPTPTAKPPAAKPPKPEKECPADFPLKNQQGNCYRKECSDGKKKMKDGKVRGKGRWHIHQNGNHQHMSPKCD